MAGNYPVDLPLALGRRWRVAHNSTGSTTTDKAFKGKGSWAGNMRQQEHFDEATAACWVTFCAEAIRPLTLFAAPHLTMLSPSRGCLANLFAGLLYFIESRQSIFCEEVIDRLDQKLLNLRVSLDCHHI
jgi:hypothetical protein